MNEPAKAKQARWEDECREELRKLKESTRWYIADGIIKSGLGSIDGNLTMPLGRAFQLGREAERGATPKRKP